MYSKFQTFAVIWILYIFFWVFPRRQIVVGRRFGTLYQFHLQRLDVVYIQPLKMELLQGSETSTNYNLTPGKYPKEHIQVADICFVSHVGFCIYQRHFHSGNKALRTHSIIYFFQSRQRSSRWLRDRYPAAGQLTSTCEMLPFVDFSLTAIWCPSNAVTIHFFSSVIFKYVIGLLTF